MKRLIVIAITILVTGIFSLFAIIDMLFRGRKKFAIHSKRWSKVLLKIANIKVTRTGFHNLPDGKSGVLYIANHTSLFDIPVLLAYLPGDVRIIYKKELEKIPVFGLGIKLSGFIAIDRENPREAIKSIEAAIDTIKDGASVVIFPEGTRQRDGVMGTFKRGAFVLATKAQGYIYPLALKNVWRTTLNDTINAANVEIVALEKINFMPANSKEEKELIEIIRSEIEKILLN